MASYRYLAMGQFHAPSKSGINRDKLIAVISYFTVIGWFIAILLYSNHRSNFSTFHLRQSLGLALTAALLSFIPLIGWLLSIVVFILWLSAIYYAVKGEQHLVPWVGQYYQEHLDFIQ
jgi:uncharacterized membrane protein